MVCLCHYKETGQHLVCFSFRNPAHLITWYQLHAGEYKSSVLTKSLQCCLCSSGCLCLVNQEKPSRTYSGGVNHHTSLSCNIGWGAGGKGRFWADGSVTKTACFFWCASFSFAYRTIVTSPRSWLYSQCILNSHLLSQQMMKPSVELNARI